MSRMSKSERVQKLMRRAKSYGVEYYKMMGSIRKELNGFFEHRLCGAIEFEKDLLDSRAYGILRQRKKDGWRYVPIGGGQFVFYVGGPKFVATRNDCEYSKYKSVHLRMLVGWSKELRVAGFGEYAEVVEYLELLNEIEQQEEVIDCDFLYFQDNTWDEDEIVRINKVVVVGLNRVTFKSDEVGESFGEIDEVDLSVIPKDIQKRIDGYYKRILNQLKSMNSEMEEKFKRELLVMNL